jgi:hypothetical protein
MRSRIVLSAAALLLGCALPALAAGGAPTAPTGALEAKIQPRAGNATYGLAHGTGWACDDSGIKEVLIIVDGTPQVRALLGYRRPAVTRRFPGCTTPAFVFAIDTTTFLNGTHTVTARVTANDGGVKILGPVKMQFLNADHMLKPFGLQIFPNPDAVQYGYCNLSTLPRRFAVIDGVAFDSGVTPFDTGVHNVDLLVDGSMVVSTKTACGFNAAMGGFSNCYGLPSLGWTSLYPSLPNSDRATWRFVIDVGQLISAVGYREGSHEIIIRADDKAGYYRNIAKFNTFWQCTEDLPNEPSFGEIENPANEQPYSGTITVTGWAMDREGIAPNGIEFRVNFTLDGYTNPTIPRPDLSSHYPGYPVGTAGFTYQLDTTKYNDGVVTIEMWVTDLQGDRQLVAERQITIDNVIGP